MKHTKVLSYVLFLGAALPAFAKEYTAVLTLKQNGSELSAVRHFRIPAQPGERDMLLGLDVELKNAEGDNILCRAQISQEDPSADGYDSLWVGIQKKNPRPSASFALGSMMTDFNVKQDGIGFDLIAAGYSCSLKYTN